MSKYTTELRWICEEAYREIIGGDPDVAPLNTIISCGYDKIFWQDSEMDIAMNYHNAFPIYDENHRLELCFKIIKHYYTREIGAETFGLWKLWINERMNEIMPYYNQLYESADIKYNPLNDVNYKRTGNKNEIGESENNRNKENEKEGNYVDAGNENRNRSVESDRNGNENSFNTSQNNSENINKYSETPQNGLSGVLDGTYLTTANVTDENNSGTNTGVSENTEHNESEDNAKSDYNRIGNNKNTENETETQRNTNNNTGVWEETIEGKMAGKSYAKMIMEYRDAILNIDKMIIEELKDLFFYLW